MEATLRIRTAKQPKESHVNFLKGIAIALIFIIAMLSMAGCEKTYDFEPVRNEKPQTANDTVANKLVKVKYQKSAITGTIINGQTLNFTGLGIATLFNLDPITPGNWNVSLGGNIVKTSTSQSEFHYDFPTAGTYTITVSGTYNGASFSYVATIIVTATVIPTTNTTGPVRYLSITGSGNNWVLAFRGVRNSTTATNFFSVGNISNWVHQAATLAVVDSVDFSITVAKTYSSRVRFNYGFEDGSTGGMWMTSSGVFFSNKDYDGNGTIDNLFDLFVSAVGQVTNDAGQVITPKTTTTLPTMPGNNGEGGFRYSTILSPYSISTWILYPGTETIYARYRYDATTAWTTPVLTTRATTNTEYVTTNIPLNTGTGEKFVYIQYGMINASQQFVPVIISAGTMWDAANQCIKLRY